MVVNFPSNVEKHAGKAVAVQGDVSKGSDVVALFDKAEEAFGKVHIVVNSKGAFLVSREAARQILANASGRIVNIMTTPLIRYRKPWNTHQQSLPSPSGERCSLVGVLV